MIAATTSVLQYQIATFGHSFMWMTLPNLIINVFSSKPATNMSHALAVRLEIETQSFPKEIGTKEIEII